MKLRHGSGSVFTHTENRRREGRVRVFRYERLGCKATYRSALWTKSTSVGKKILLGICIGSRFVNAGSFKHCRFKWRTNTSLSDADCRTHSRDAGASLREDARIPI